MSVGGSGVTLWGKMDLAKLDLYLEQIMTMGISAVA